MSGSYKGPGHVTIKFLRQSRSFTGKGHVFKSR